MKNESMRMLFFYYGYHEIELGLCNHGYGYVRLDPYEIPEIPEILGEAGREWWV